MIKIIDKKISLSELSEIAYQSFGNLVKVVIDIDKEIMAVGGELHADEETVLLQTGSSQNNLWGINLYPDKFPSYDWIEFDSIINLRPLLGNKTRRVENPQIKEKIIKIVNQLLKNNGI